MKNVLLLCAFISLYGCGPTVKDLKELAPTETFPEDTFLRSISNKRALVVVAHDDDLVAMSGTISKLHGSGWDVRELCLISDNPARDSVLVNAAKGVMHSVEFIPIPPNERRKGNDTLSNPWMPITRVQIDREFDKNRIAGILTEKINDFDPTVVFSLDNEIGGYGHPEHVLVSQVVADLYQADSIKPERVYQSVYSNSMEQKILKERLTKMLEDWGYPNAYMSVLKLYNTDGMPEPTVQVNIKDQSAQKMKFLRSFAEAERRTISHFVPYFEDFDHEEYFAVFDREFFRVLPAKQK